MPYRQAAWFKLPGYSRQYQESSNQQGKSMAKPSHDARIKWIKSLKCAFGSNPSRSCAKVKIHSLRLGKSLRQAVCFPFSLLHTHEKLNMPNANPPFFFNLIVPGHTGPVWFHKSLSRMTNNNEWYFGGFMLEGRATSNNI